MTHGAKLVMVNAVKSARDHNASQITIRHLLYGIMSAEAPDPAILLLEFLGIDIDRVRESLGW